jgi:hypothetical protein
MRLSEAIRLGSMLRKQGFGRLFVHAAEGDLRSCALGAAEEALRGGAAYDWRHADKVGDVYTIYSELLDSRNSCPRCAERDVQYSAQTQAIVHHLNDDHRWTREAIADWLEALELQPAPAAEPQPELATT